MRKILILIEELADKQHEGHGDADISMEVKGFTHHEILGFLEHIKANVLRDLLGDTAMIYDSHKTRKVPDKN